MDQEFITAYHWLWAGLFAGIGIFFAFRPACMVRVEPYVSRLALPPPERERLMAVAGRREALEGLSPRLGHWMALAAGLMAILAAVTDVPVGLLYAALCVAIAGIATGFFLQLRQAQRRRVAILAYREPHRLVPAWLPSLLMAESLLTFCGVTLSSWWPPLVVSLASIAVILLAERISVMPSMVEGEDIAVETFLDDHLRAGRAAALYALAAAQPMVFLTQQVHAELAGQLRWPAAHMAGEVAALLCAAIVIGIVARIRRGRVAQSEYGSWGAA